ncbi:unnamed protein product [Paramecium sonneborni]|uniref:Uncharacterized protein n=1 Tax=Paramecium sonneborni TaxID=65129 RepID=A0A8S1RN25_9CILI|nr:unnamed protein product [Paramecium sonneborni]
MIDNIVNMIQGLKNTIDIEIYLIYLNRLGWFRNKKYQNVGKR